MGYGAKGATTLLELADTPASYNSQANKLVKVNGGGSATIFDLLLAFSSIFDGGSDTPTDVAWGFEAPVPFTMVSSLYFSPITTNALGELIVYVIDRGTNFYRYNITRASWTKLASPGEVNSHYRSLAPSPDWTKLCCPTKDMIRVMVYTIATDSWDESGDLPLDPNSFQLYARSCVWEDNDKVWMFATRSSNRGMFIYYTPSTKIFMDTTGKNTTGVVSTYEGSSCAFKTGYLYASRVGDSPLKFVKLDISGDSYSFVQKSGITWINVADKDNLWYHQQGTSSSLGYMDIDTETLHSGHFANNTAATLPMYAAGVNPALTKVISEALAAQPRNMTYQGTGMWRLKEEVLGDNCIIIIDKPIDGYDVDLIDVTNQRHARKPYFDSITIPAGTWAFYYPKDGDYTKVKIIKAPLK